MEITQAENTSANIKRFLEKFSETLPHFPDGRIDYSGSSEALVLTCFVRYQGRILLLQRSDQVGTYRKMWNSVAGYVDEEIPIKDKILEELEEELGLSEDMISSLKIGSLYEFRDDNINKTWIVIPCLADLDRAPEIRLDWEHLEYAWIYPEEIDKFSIVPNLKISLERVLRK